MLVVREKAPIPFNAIKIWLTKGMFTFVSPWRITLIGLIYWRAVKSSSGYYARGRYQKNGRTITVRMHRLITGALDGQRVHHKDHNRLNNTDENLEVQTEREHRTTDGWRYFEH